MTKYLSSTPCMNLIGHTVEEILPLYKFYVKPLPFINMHDWESQNNRVHLHIMGISLLSMTLTQLLEIPCLQAGWHIHRHQHKRLLSLGHSNHKSMLTTLPRWQAPGEWLVFVLELEPLKLYHPHWPCDAADSLALICEDNVNFKEAAWQDPDTLLNNTRWIDNRRDY